MNRLGGYVCVRNGIQLDYCFELAIQSLIPVCDELVLCDSDSTDGTRERLEAYAARDKGIRVINYPWPNPKGESDWWIKWLNFARCNLTSEMQITLDADEVLDNSMRSYRLIREATRRGRSLRMDRLNFWRDSHSLIPDGHCCGKYVVRLGPAHYEMPSDEPRHPGERPILDEAENAFDIKIFHLGFLRKPEAFYAKAKVVIPAFFHRYDPRLEKAEKDGLPLWKSECDFADKLVPYVGHYPPGVKRWLTERGYT